MATFEIPDHVAQPRAVPARRRGARLQKVARSAGVALCVLGMVVGTGAAYEQMASTGDAAAYPPSGRLVDVGGYELHLDCRGEGSPTVVMDAGLGGSSLDWILVQPDLSRTERVCTYDRAGMGWSEPGPQPRSPANLAAELHMLLEKGGIPGPYVLVGHSLAGKNIRMFAAAHPQDVAGMVLVDARSEVVEASSDPTAFAAALDAQAAIYTVARQIGVARLLGGALVEAPQVSTDLATQMALFQTSPAAIAETTHEGLSRTADDEALASASLGSIPLIVIAAGESMRNLPDWPAGQNAMVALSTNGHLVVAEGSGHAIQLIQPSAVIDAVNHVLASVRGIP
jgi:pimeloyl-ACP methyl ester carboxylesterase